MRRLLALLLLTACTTACTEVNYGGAINFGPDGVAASPYISGSSGNAHLTLGL